MLSLDVSKANHTSMSEFENQWATESPNTAGISIPRRRDNQYAVVGSQLVLSGGSSNPEWDPGLVDQTIAYNADDNTWRSYPNYVEDNFGNRQIYYAATTVVPSKGLAFYGGYERPFNKNWTIETKQNFTQTSRTQDNFRAIGYVRVVYLDITNTVNPWTIPPQTNVPDLFSSFQASIYDPASSKIYYIGGTFEDTLNPAYDWTGLKSFHSLAYALTFDTFSGEWGNQTLTGNVIPTNRKYHTTTLLPNAQSTVLLYGGETSSIVSMDYCFTLDLKSFTWTQLNINAPGVDLRRSAHTATLVNNETLFIVMGFNGLDTLTSVPVVLNVSDPKNITYVEYYTDPSVRGAKTVDAPGDAAGGTVNGDVSKGGLSAGAIAGIAVGAAAGVIIALAAIFVCRRRKRAQKKKNQSIATDNRTHETIEVNWDEIDRQYTEIPTPMRDEDKSTTFGNNSSSNGSTVPNGSPILPDVAEAHTANSFDLVRQQYVTKPDSGNIS